MRILALLVAAILAAGCSDAPPAVEEPASGPAARDVQVGKDTGAISGVVVDLTIMPIAGATISVVGAQMVVQTDEGGTFVIEDLVPGTYFLNVSAPGHAPIQAQAPVEAGQVSKLRVLLEAVPTIEPLHQALVHDGYIQVNGGVSGPILNIILEEMTGSNPLCDCTLRFNTEGLDVRTLVIEAVWKDNVAMPTGPTDMYLEVFPAELDDGTDDIQGGFLTSPILKHYPIELWGEGENNVDWRARLSGSGYFVQYDQSYEMFVTVFHNAPAPDGWSIVGGDA